MEQSYLITFWNGVTVDYQSCNSITEVGEYIAANGNKVDILSIKKTAWAERNVTLKRITVKMMAEAMGVNEQAIRVGMQQKKLDLGSAYKRSGDQYTYFIEPEKAKKMIGETAFMKMMNGATAGEAV